MVIKHAFLVGKNLYKEEICLNITVLKLHQSFAAYKMPIKYCGIQHRDVGSHNFKG